MITVMIVTAVVVGSGGCSGRSGSWCGTFTVNNVYIVIINIAFIMIVIFHIIIAVFVAVAVDFVGVAAFVEILAGDGDMGGTAETVLRIYNTIDICYCRPVSSFGVLLRSAGIRDNNAISSVFTHVFT